MLDYLLMVQLQILAQVFSKSETKLETILKEMGIREVKKGQF